MGTTGQADSLVPKAFFLFEAAPLKCFKRKKPWGRGWPAGVTCYTSASGSVHTNAFSFWDRLFKRRRFHRGQVKKASGFQDAVVYERLKWRTAFENFESIVCLF